MPKLDDLIEFSGEDNVYEVEKVVGVHRLPGKQPLYRVRWKGYGPEEDTYEPRDHLLTCEDMIDEYLLEEERKQEEAAAKKEKKKAVKRKYSGESPPPSPSQPSSPSKTNLTEVKPEKEEEEVAVSDVQRTPPVSTGQNADTEENDEDDDVDRRALLKDPFWNDLENGVIVPNLFETDMYSKVKSRRATLEAKRKKKDEETEEQKNTSLSESQSSEKSSPGSASKKKESPPSKEEEGTRRHKKKKHSNKHDPGKKKKKKKSHKSKKKHRHVKMDLEAIGSLESATQKSLKMSPSDLDGSDNSANLFISCKPAEEVLTVAKLLEQSRQSSSNGSQSSDSWEDSDQVVKAKDTEVTNTTEESALRVIDSSQSDQSQGMGFLSPDLEKMLERNPFSLNEDTDAETAKTLSSSEQIAHPKSTSKDATSSPSFEESPSLWDQFAKELPIPPPCDASSERPTTTSTISGPNSSLQAISEMVKKEPVDNIPGDFVIVKEEINDDVDKSSADIVQTESSPLILNEHLESGQQHHVSEQRPVPAESPTIVKKEPVDPEESANSAKENSKAGSKTSPLTNMVTKQESLEIPDSIEDHLTSVEPALETVLKSQSLGTTEELPNLTGNLFDNFLPVNSPFTDDEQRNSGSEEPKIDVGQLLSSLEDKDMQNKSSAVAVNNSLPLPAIEPSAEIPEKELGSASEITEQSETNTKEPPESEMTNIEGKQTAEASSLMWPWSGPGPLTSPKENITKIGPEDDLEGNETKSQESEDGNKNHQGVQGILNVLQGSNTDGEVSDKEQRGSETASKEIPDVGKKESKVCDMPPDSIPKSGIASKDTESLTISADKTSSKIITKETEITDTSETTNGHQGNNLFDSLKSCLNKDKPQEKSQKSKKDVASKAVVNELANAAETKKSRIKPAAKLSVLQKGQQAHEKASKVQLKQPKKQILISEKAKEVSKSNKVTRPSRKDEERNNNVKILHKGMDKTTLGNKDQETRKKQLHAKPEEKKKKKITGGSWKFESISEIPRNDENKVPVDLIDKSSNLDEDYLCKAITEGDFHLVQAVLHHRPNLQVDTPNSRGQRPLVLACMGGQNEILKKLILSRATVDVRLNNGVTPLMIAAELGYTSTAGILLEAGASVNLANTSGETALIKASRKGHVDVVQQLLHYGADWGQTSQENTSALSLAKQHKMYLVSEVLQKHEQRMVEQLEYVITQYMMGTARLVHSVLPSRCFRIRESTQHHIKFNFDPTKVPFSPTLGTMLFLCHVSPGVSGMSCHLTGPCHVKGVTLNGVPTSPVPEGNGFVMEFIPKAGVNALNITTHPDPYTKMLLLVAAYSLQLTQS